jgi:hypothetical protein
MWPYKLMPDPRGAKRLATIGCDVAFAKSRIKVPVEVKNYEDFVQGTRYPKMEERPIWFVQIKMPKELMNDIKEGSIDLADQTIDLEEIDNAYEDDLDKQDGGDQDAQAPMDMGAPLGAPPASPVQAPV